VGDIAQAFLTADRPKEVYRMALDRLCPLLGASFACVFLREGETPLLQIVAAYNWPQRHANYLSAMRVRVGNGPTGRAVQDDSIVEVEDVFSNPELADWWEPARELGFKSSISLPLVFGEGPVGALTFYFRDLSAFREADRNLLKLVANQLAATAEKAHLIEDLQRVNLQLTGQNADLETRYRDAEETRRLKNEFLANISHELRTPLTAILGYAYLLREGISGNLNGDQVGSVRKIEDAGGQLLSLIESLLDLTSVKLGRLQTEPELCDAVALARMATTELGPIPEPVTLKTEMPGESVPIHTDPVLVQRVLQCLLNNAVKFTPEGTVTLRLHVETPEPSSQQHYRRGLDVVWEVQDTGIGIAEKDHDLIFEEFRQADGSATRRFGGAGLGLAVARGLAQRLGGDVRVESTLGHGAKFILSLPSSVVRAGSKG
jgi:signal transduction histidine kinase